MKADHAKRSNEDFFYSEKAKLPHTPKPLNMLAPNVDFCPSKPCQPPGPRSWEKAVPLTLVLHLSWGEWRDYYPRGCTDMSAPHSAFLLTRPGPGQVLAPLHFHTEGGLSVSDLPRKNSGTNPSSALALRKCAQQRQIKAGVPTSAYSKQFLLIDCSAMVL